MKASIPTQSGRVKYYIMALIRRLRTYSPDQQIRENKIQIVTGYLPDKDFELFDYLQPATGLVIDAGANRGHCALAILSRTPKLRVHAFEPNNRLEKPLRYIHRRFPRRFEYTLCGLGAESGKQVLKIPVGGGFNVSTNASFRSSEFVKDYVQERLEDTTGVSFQHIRFESLQADIRTIDSFGLDPVAIKIDVEGLELSVLKGALNTINRCRPMLLIEMNNQHEFLPLLESLGYRFYRYQPDQNRLLEIHRHKTYLNVVCLHQNTSYFPQQMIKKLRQAD